MKAIFSAATLMLAACVHQPATAVDVPGTSVRGGHITNVTRDVQGWHNAQNPNCLFTRPLKATVVERDNDSVTERWTIEGCEGRRFEYEVYVMSMGGGITVMVSNADGSSASVGNQEQEFSAPSAEECDAMSKEFDRISSDDSDNADYSSLAQLAANLAVCNTRTAP